MEILASSRKKLSELYAHFNKYYCTPEIKVPTTEEKKLKIVDSVLAYCQEKGFEVVTVDGVRVQYEEGWALVRASNTGPNLTLRFEAKSEERLEELKTEYMNLVDKLNL